MKNRYAYFLIILSFILGSSFTLFFISLDNGEINNEYFSKLGFGISYNNINNRYFLFILIMSNPDNSLQRKALRETWLQFIQLDVPIKYLFVIGSKELVKEKLNILTNEQAEYNDILLLDNLIDSYNTLSKKLLESLVIIHNRYQFKFLLKCDDDSFVQIDPLISELKTNFHDTAYLYWGYFNGQARVKKVGKWKESNWILCDNYLPYALGGGYVLSRNLVKYIADNSYLLSLYKSEDVSLGVWLSPINISRIHDVRFDTEFESRGCSNLYLITHKKKNTDMRHLYSELVTHGRMCSEEIQIKHSYLYNWNVLPSKCCVRNNTLI